MVLWRWLKLAVDLVALVTLIVISIGLAAFTAMILLAL